MVEVADASPGITTAAVVQFVGVATGGTKGRIAASSGGDVPIG
jgi:hypothetical protein